MAPEQTSRPLDVSVIIPAYQAAETLGRALSSVAAQTAAPAEVIVVDDGSSDGTADVAETFRAVFAHCRFVVLTQSNQGPGAARNAALQAATCKYVAFLDADDEWLAPHLKTTLGWLTSEDLLLAAHNEFLVEDGTETLNDSLSRLREHTDPYVAMYRKGCISTSTVITEREAISRVGGFDPDLANGQDVDLWLALLSPPDARFDIFGPPLSRYMIRPGSINTNISKRYHFFMIITRRWAGQIMHRDGGAMSDLWFRVSAIHYEAFKGHRKNGNRFSAFSVCLRYPFNMAEITVRGLIKAAPHRQLNSTLTPHQATQR